MSSLTVEPNAEYGMFSMSIPKKFPTITAYADPSEFMSQAVPKETYDDSGLSLEFDPASFKDLDLKAEDGYSE